MLYLCLHRFYLFEQPYGWADDYDVDYSQYQREQRRPLI